MSMPNAVTPGTTAAARNPASASHSAHAAADASDGGLDFASLLLGLGGADEALSGEVTKDRRDALKADDTNPQGMAVDAKAAVPASEVPAAPSQNAVDPTQGDGAKVAWAGVAAARPAGGGADTAAQTSDALAAVSEGRGAAVRKNGALLPSTGKLAPAATKGNGAASAAADPSAAQGPAAANTGQGRAAAFAASMAAASRGESRGDNAVASLQAKSGDLQSQLASPSTVSMNSWTPTAALSSEQKRDLLGADRAPATAEVGWSAAGAMGATGALTPQSVTSVAPDAGLTTQMQVAEQVSYWIGQGVQNAEVEVHGLAENPIQVSIDLQGIEAHVAFRAEQPETRQVLQDAVPQLRDLLEREGLVLSGVSVGVNSGGDGAQRQAAGQSEGRRVGRVKSAETVDMPVAAAASRPRPAGAAGRSLDLFV